jgi:hypothetical protein
MRRFLLVFPMIGCKAHLQMEVMEPAEVSIPNEVQTLAVVNREVSPLSKRSIEELSAALVDSPRYKIVDQGAAQSSYKEQGGTVGTPLQADATESICKATGASGVVSLERYRDAGDWHYHRDVRTVTETQTKTITHEDGSETTQEEQITRDEEYFVATYRGDLETDWTVYGCKGQHHDDFPLGMIAEWSAEGLSAADAKIMVGDVDELERELAEDLGRRYLTRISPYKSVLNRRYFRGPNKNLRAGHRAIRYGEYEEARKHWKTASESTRTKVQAKGWLNLAVIQENKGNMDRALKLSNKAGKVLDQYWVDDYSQVLSDRLERLSRLEAQMAAPPPPPVEVGPASKPEEEEAGAAVKPEAEGAAVKPEGGE